MTSLFSALQQWCFILSDLKVIRSTRLRMKMYQTIFETLFHHVNTAKIKSHSNATTTTLHLCVSLHLTNNFLMKYLKPSTISQGSFLKFPFCVKGLRLRGIKRLFQGHLNHDFQFQTGTVVFWFQVFFALHQSPDFWISRSCGDFSGSLNSAWCFLRSIGPLLFSSGWTPSMLKLALLILVWLLAFFSNSSLA